MGSKVARNFKLRIPIVLLLVGLFLGFKFGVLYSRGNLNFFDTIINADLFNANILGITLGAILTALIAFWRYKKQRDYENISKRYLENGFEDLIQYLNEIRMTIEDNYALTIQTLRYFRDLDYVAFKIWLETRQPGKQLSSMMPSSYGICSLILKDKSFQVLCIENFIKSAQINEYFVSEIPQLLLSESISNDLRVADSREKRKGIADKLAEEAANRQRQTHEDNKLYQLISILERILLRSRALNIDSYEKLENVNQDKEIVKLSGNFKGLLESKEIIKN